MRTFHLITIQLYGKGLLIFLKLFSLFFEFSFLFLSLQQFKFKLKWQNQNLIF